MGKRSMIADIAVDQSGWAEWFFVIAAVLFVIAAVGSFIRHSKRYTTTATEGSTRGLPGWIEPVALELGLAFIALGLLVL